MQHDLTGTSTLFPKYLNKQTNTKEKRKAILSLKVPKVLL